MLKVCLVTPELAPFTSGGIGVLIHNIILEYSSSGVEFHVLVLENAQVNDIAFTMIFPKAKLWRIADLNLTQDPMRDPPEEAFTTHSWHYRSFQVAKALQRLASQGVVFDFVEFPDWGGLAFCSCQDKLLGNWDHAQIAVRIHSTDSILRPGQPVAGGASAAHLADLERKALRDADIVIAHLETIAKATKQHFGFNNEWSKKVRVNRPPVAIESRKKLALFGIETPICFPSKIQELKRPDVFLNGALTFVNATPDFHGKIVFTAHPTDARLQAHLQSRIPEHLHERVSFSTNMPQAARASLMEKAISVFPSPFESFCLAAYEASMMGGLVALNARNPAFSDETAWVDLQNCLKFDGTALSLAESLSTAWRNRTSLRMTPIRHVATRTPYWLLGPFKREDQSPTGRTAFRSTSTQIPLVSVIIPYFNMGKYIARTLESVLSSSYPKLEVILVDDCSSDAYSKKVLNEIKEDKRFETIRVVSALANVGLSGARNLGVRASRGAYILTLDADDLIHHDFIEVAVGALERNSDHAIVVPQTAFFSDEDSTTEINVIDYAVFIGEAMRGGSFSNRFSTATSLARRELFDEFPYDETLTSYEDWDFYARLVWAGKRFIVTNQVYFYYRRRAGSMLAENNNERHVRNMSILRSKQRVELPQLAFDMNIVSDAEGHAEFLRTNAAIHAVNQARGRGDQNENNVEKIHVRLKQLNKQLRNAHALLNSIQLLVNDIGWSPPISRGHESRKTKTFFFKAFRRKMAIKKTARKLVSSGQFDPEWYLAKYPDVSLSGMDPAQHYVMFGRYEGRASRPSGLL